MAAWEFRKAARLFRLPACPRGESMAAVAAAAAAAAEADRSNPGRFGRLGRLRKEYGKAASAAAIEAGLGKRPGGGGGPAVGFDAGNLVVGECERSGFNCCCVAEEKIGRVETTSGS